MLGVNRAFKQVIRTGHSKHSFEHGTVLQLLSEGEELLLLSCLRDYHSASHNVIETSETCSFVRAPGEQHTKDKLHIYIYLYL